MYWFQAFEVVCRMQMTSTAPSSHLIAENEGDSEVYRQWHFEVGDDSQWYRKAVSKLKSSSMRRNDWGNYFGLAEKQVDSLCLLPCKYDYLYIWGGIDWLLIVIFGTLFKYCHVFLLLSCFDHEQFFIASRPIPTILVSFESPRPQFSNEVNGQKRLGIITTGRNAMPNSSWSNISILFIGFKIPKYSI